MQSGVGPRKGGVTAGKGVPFEERIGVRSFRQFRVRVDVLFITGYAQGQRGVQSRHLVKRKDFSFI